jgi:hypothetical protein
MIAEILGKYEISFDPRNITRSLDGEVDLDILYSGLPVVNSKLVIVWYHMGQGSFKIRSYLK